MNHILLTEGLFLEPHAFRTPVLTYGEFLRTFQSVRFA